MSYLNQAIGRFTEAASLDHAAHALELRNSSFSALPEQQLQQRKAIIAIAVHLIREMRDELIKLGIYEYTRASDPNLPPDVEL